MIYQPVNLHRKKSDALVVHCADPRFQQAYRQVIDGLGNYYDLVVVPGASKAIVDNDKVIDDIKLLHSLHHFEKVHIMDHINCGAFGEIKDEIKIHSKMLGLAMRKLQGILPELEIELHLLGENQKLPLETQG